MRAGAYGLASFAGTASTDTHTAIAAGFDERQPTCVRNLHSHRNIQGRTSNKP